MESIAFPLVEVAFPRFIGLQVYMQKLKVADIIERRKTPVMYATMVSNMVKRACLPTDMEVFLTIDEREVKAGEAHRRGGAHVDGNYIYTWGRDGGGWLNGTPGRILTPEQHAQQYQSPLGGTIIASNYEGCDVWTGEVAGIPGQGGDCEHLRPQFDSLTKFRMKANRAYIGNSLFIHQSMPLDSQVKRQLIRLTLAPNFNIASLQ
jgi:hypothetical protein